MKVQSLMEFVDAAVDTKFVQGPYDERGGLMIVGYPGSLKTTILKSAMEPHADSMVISDINVQQWLKIRDDFVTGRYTAMGFTDFEKIYQRHHSTATHIEGIIRGLVAEGYGTGPNGDTRMPVIPARAFVAGAMTNSCMEARYNDWQKTGFLRRFLWFVISIQNQNKISQAIRDWKKIDFGRIVSRPATRQITFEFTKERTMQLESMMREQPGFNGVGYVLLKKVVAVLEWRHQNDKKHVTEVLEDVSSSMTKNGGMIRL